MRVFVVCAALALGPGCGKAAASPTPSPAPPQAEPAARKAGVDWPCFLGPTHDSKSPETGLKWPAEGPRKVWERELGEGYAPCSVSKGRLYQFDRSGGKARLACLKSETGEPVWTFEYASEYDDMYGYDPGPRCAPVVDDDRVYILGVEGQLHCLQAADGKKVWSKDTTKEFGVQQNFFGVGGAPVVEGDLLIANIGGSPPGSPGIQSGQLKGNGSGIVAFDKKTGEVKYKVTDELASYASPQLATIGGRRWGFVFARGGLVGFEPATGKVDFHYPWRAPILESVNAANPVVVDDRVLVSECYGVGASVLKVKPGGYDVVWLDGRKRDRSLMTHWNTPIHVDGYVYASSGRHTPEAELRCVELATGKVQWAEPRLTRASLLHVDGHFVCLGEDGVLRLIKVDPKQYREVGKLVLKGASGEPLLKYPAWAAPLLSHGLLYVRGKDRLVCLELIPEK
ncbi:MAG TPA: PQQ-binding-like beta-propeller repeat protein [Planctomycetota bacterium]|nr:PQQ-binding-like beta-propeller repeat protein [Planctomycetota bacterium]